MNANANQPAYRAYTVIKREAQSDFWAPIGVAFSHHDGLGLNVLLSALPIDGKIVLRPTKENNPVEASE